MPSRAKDQPQLCVLCATRVMRGRKFGVKWGEFSAASTGLPDPCRICGAACTGEAVPRVASTQCVVAAGVESVESVGRVAWAR